MAKPVKTTKPLEASVKEAEALKYLLFAAQFDPKGQYLRFVENLKTRGIPYSYTDERFLEALVDFSDQFRSYLADAKVPESQIESAVPADVLAPLVAELAALPATVARVKRERVEEITATYVRELKKSVGRFTGEETFKRNLTEDIFRLALSTKNPEAFGENLESYLAGKTAALSTDPQAIQTVARPVAHSVIAESARALPALVAEPQEEITRAAIESQVKRKDMVIKIYAAKSGRESSPNVEEVNKLAAVAEALTAKFSANPGQDPTSPTVFFQTGAKGLQKPLAALADAFLTVYPKDVRDNIIESVLARGWERSVERIGRAVAESPLLTSVIEKGNQAFGAGQPSSFRGLTNAINDTAMTIFGSPRTTDDILALVELGIIKEEYITGYLPAYAASAHAHSSGLFEFFHLVGGEAAGWGMRRAGQAVVAKAGGSALGKFVGGLLGTVGGVPGMILGAFAGSGLASIFSRREPGPPKKWYQDWSITGILFPVVMVVVPILALSLMTLFLHVTYTGALQEPEVGGGLGGVIVDCAKNPTHPYCSFEPCTGDCLWPTSGYITQGPYAQCHDSHERLNAVDIGANYLTPVYSITDGTVVEVRGGCADTVGRASTTWSCNGKWGNYVDIQAPNGTIIRYAHLSIQFIDRVSTGESVTKGKTIIGKVDNNGASTGSHLHIGIQSGVGSILNLLPLTKEQQQEVFGCSNSRGCPACPNIQTGS